MLPGTTSPCRRFMVVASPRLPCTVSGTCSVLQVCLEGRSQWDYRPAGDHGKGCWRSAGRWGPTGSAVSVTRQQPFQPLLEP